MGRGDEIAAGGLGLRTIAHLAIVVVFVLTALGYAPLRDPASTPVASIDHEAARAAVRPLPGVKAAAWLDQANLAVLVDDASRGIATIDRVCDALSPLGDTLAVVVHLQDARARIADAATMRSRTASCRKGSH